MEGRSHFLTSRQVIGHTGLCEPSKYLHNHIGICILFTLDPWHFAAGHLVFWRLSIRQLGPGHFGPRFVSRTFRPRTFGYCTFGSSNTWFPDTWVSGHLSAILSYKMWFRRPPFEHFVGWGRIFELLVLLLLVRRRLLLISTFRDRSCVGRKHHSSFRSICIFSVSIV